MWAVWRRNAAIDRYGCRARARACTLAQNRTARCSLYAALSLGTGPQADTQGAGANSDLRRPRCADHDRDPGQIHSFIVDRSVPYSCTAVSSRSHLINRGRAARWAYNELDNSCMARGAGRSPVFSFRHDIVTSHTRSAVRFLSPRVVCLAYFAGLLCTLPSVFITGPAVSRVRQPSVRAGRPWARDLRFRVTLRVTDNGERDLQLYS